MFDFSDSQKRERLLIILAGIVLCGIVTVAVPAQFHEITRSKNERDKLIADIETHETDARNKDEIQSRLSAMLHQALVQAPVLTRDSTPQERSERSVKIALESRSVSNYQNWLRDLARSSGLGNVLDVSAPGTSGTISGIYKKHTFSITGDGRIEHIAEFLRRFHRTEYLHRIHGVQPRSIQNQPGMFNVRFQVEALSLPQVSEVHTPNGDGDAVPLSDDEVQMLATIRERAILSEYSPPRSNVEVPPPPPFDPQPYCFVIAIVQADGRPQCWINHRIAGRTYFLFEEGAFMLGNVNCTVKKIEVNGARVQIAAGGGVYAIGVGKSFEEYDEPSYFFTGIVDENDEPWTEDSTGEPRAVIVHGTETDNGMAERAKYTLSAGETFPMAYLSGTVASIDPAAHQIQIEAAGVVYTIRTGGSFAEFGNE